MLCFLFILIHARGRERLSVGLLAVTLVRNGQLLATLSATRCQYTTTIGSGHSLTETVLVYAATVVGLKCSFHNVMLILFDSIPVSGCKIRYFFSI